MIVGMVLDIIRGARAWHQCFRDHEADNANPNPELVGAVLSTRTGDHGRPSDENHQQLQQ